MSRLDINMRKNANVAEGLFGKILPDLLKDMGSTIAPVRIFNPGLHSEITKAEEAYKAAQELKPSFQIDGFDPMQPFQSNVPQPSSEDYYRGRKYLQKKRDRFVMKNAPKELISHNSNVIKDYDNIFKLKNDNYKGLVDQERKLYDSNQNIYKQKTNEEMAEIANQRRQAEIELGSHSGKLDSYYRNVGLVSAGAATTLGGLAINAIRNRNIEKAFLNLAPETRDMFSTFHQFKGLGFNPRDVKEMTETLVKEKELGMKDLEAERLHNDLDRQNTLMGRIGRTSIGQFLGPLAGGTLVAGGGLAGMKVLDTLSNMGIPDPSLDLSVHQNLQEVIRIKPMLKNIDPSLLLDYYRLIFRIAPSVGRDVHVASNLLEKMVNYGGADHMLMKELAETEKSMKDRVKTQMDYVNTGNQLFGMSR
jgi:hypothetical protein